MKSKKFSFKGKVTKASQKKARERSSYGYLNLPKGVNVYSAEPDSRITLDFLPYKVSITNHPDKDDKEGTALKGGYWYRLPFKIHRKVGVGEDTVVCLTTFGKKCPICEYKAKKVAEKADKDEIKSYNTSDRNLYVVNPLDSSKHEKGKWHVFDISNAMFQKLLDDELEEESIPEDFMDPESGVSLKTRFKGNTIGGGKPFPEATKIEAIKRAKQYSEAVADQTPVLDQMLIVLSYDELEKKFFELPEDDDDEDETPKSKKSSKKKPAPVEEDDDEDDDEEDEEDDDEEEEKPRNKKSVKTPPAKTTSKKKPVEEEDDEEEDDDDDEEDEDDDDEELQTSLADEINECTTVDEAIVVARANPAYYKKHLKTLKAITKIKALKKAMLDLLEDDLPFKRGVNSSPSTKKTKAESDLTWNELSTMKDAGLRNLIELNELDILPSDYDDDVKSFRKVVAKELGIEIPKTESKVIPNEDKCIACKGSGKNSKGGTCPICVGTGVKQKKNETELKCPNKHRFGIDLDKFDDCSDCDLWDDCNEAKSKRKK